MAEEDQALKSSARSTTPVILGLQGPALLPAERDLLADARPAGVILFKRNLESAEQLFALCAGVRGALGPRAPIAIDQEGGRVDRLRTIGPASPRASLLGRAGVRACRTAGARTGELLAALGLNWDLAPCVDLGLHPHAVSGIGDRAFHRDPHRVAALAGAWLDGLESAGVRSCLKHFPGHGRARLDSHVDLPVIPTAERWLAADLLPYRKLAGADRPVMVAHCAYPALDPSGLPASLSPAIIGDVLRRRLGHDGVVVADDLEMGAIKNRYGMAEASRRAVDAGNDAVLVCYTPEAIRDSIEALRGRTSPRLARFLARMPAPARRFDAARVARLQESIASLSVA